MNHGYLKIAKAVREVPTEFQRFYHKQYPNFVTHDRVKSLGQQVPAFMFHTVNHVTLQDQLEFLKSNGYQTLNLQSFMAFLHGELDLTKPSVLLTFDDGEKSWYDVAYPLLKQYGFHAVGFVVPYHIKETPEASNGKAWLSWSELQEMEQSGVFEFESHSFYHAQIFVEPKVVDFFHPQLDSSWNLDVPWIQANGVYTNQLKWGTPIYQSTARLAGFPRYIDDPKVRNACVSWVESQGGKDFFNRDGWRKELNQVYYAIAEKSGSLTYESQRQAEDRMLEDLVQAKTVLSDRLNKNIEHLCYPWGIGSDVAVSLSKKAGYRSNFWICIDRRNTNQTGDDPYYIPRLKDDYLFRLPGKKRKPVWQIFQEKLLRRFAKVDIY